MSYKLFAHWRKTVHILYDNWRVRNTFMIIYTRLVPWGLTRDGFSFHYTTHCDRGRLWSHPISMSGKLSQVYSVILYLNLTLCKPRQE